MSVRWRRMIVAVLRGSALAALGVMFWSACVLGVVQEITVQWNKLYTS